MNLLKRISNIWKLGEAVQREKTVWEVIEDEHKPKLREKAQFISYKPRDPVAEIVNQDPNGN